MGPWDALLHNLRFADVVDVLLVAAAVYGLLLLIREARGTRVVVGFGALFVSGALAGRLHLNTVEWMVRGLWPVLVIAFVVVFQPDLRRLLIQAGRGRLLGGVFRGESEVFRAVTDAVRKLVKNKWGGLVVLERTDRLQELVDTGTPIDGEVTAELLVTLFNPRSPLHDGAVVLRKGKIAAAGCILPLSQNPALHKSYGTRHRAALGITEETDALAVVVSEENRSVAFAMAGKITPEIDAETLEEMLTLYGARLSG